MVAEFLIDGCQIKDFDFTKPLILEIYETFPLLLCHDGHFFINMAFEPHSFKQLSQTLAEDKMKLCEMPRYRLSIKHCQLELRQVDPKVFTSYAQLEVRMIINGEVKVLGG